MIFAHRYGSGLLGQGSHGLSSTEGQVGRLKFGRPTDRGSSGPLDKQNNDNQQALGIVVSELNF